MLTSIAAPVFVIGVLVLFHELGHFLVAKRAGIRVETFSIGFGPAIASFERGGTVYKISWVPFGGYVKMSGEDPDEEQEGPEPWRFHRKSVPIRLAVILAGPAANFVLAVAVYSLIFGVYGVDTIETTRVGQVLPDTPAARAGLLEGDVITEVDGAPVSDWRGLVEAIRDGGEKGAALVVLRDGTELPIRLSPRGDEALGFAPELDARVGEVFSGGPAAEAGLERGDRIVELSGVPIEGWDDLRETLEPLAGETVALRYERAGEIRETVVSPEAIEEEGTDGGTRTVGRLQVGQYTERRRIGPIAAVREGVLQTGWVIRNVVDFLRILVTGRATADMVGGPVSIFHLSGESARHGFDTLLSLLAFLSIELGMLNLLPVPVLDGGHLVFLLIEGVRRRPLSLKQRALLQQIGLLVILGLMVTVTVLDVGRLLG
ncbi:MAG: RIP metalloprotease RseP [Candidatus Eisenbacteria bacterium]